MTPADRARSLHPNRRVIIGIAGAPGAGKSTFAAALATELDAPVVAMDGFHLANARLDELGRRERKGAPDTFDVAGYTAVLASLRRTGDVRVPVFDRTIDEPVADAVLVPATARIVLTEGNYLLLDDGPWASVRPLLDEVWFIEVPEAVRIARLIARHVHFGRGIDDARRRATVGSDADNATIIAATRGRADLIVPGC